MVVRLQRWVTAGVICCSLLVALPLAAQQSARDRGSRGGGVDLDSTVRQIRRETGGRVLQAETRDRNGQREHHVRIITDRGKVKRYRVDAGSGEKLPRGGNRR
ncbi:MAG: hypothetical protein OQL28_04340 [Sedimenticola sp.]|nr:hypothetical protein [Sedimenticola sp.]